MQTNQQYQLDSLHRVQDFLNTHADVVGSLQTSEGRKQLDAAVAQLEAYALDQSTTNLEMTGLQNREDTLVKQLSGRYMQPITIFARAKLRGVPDFAALAGPLKGQNRKQLLHSARAMAAAAEGHSAVLTAAGFAPDAVAQLSAAASVAESAMTDRANAKVRRVGATKGIAEHTALGREAVRMINAVIINQHDDDATFLAAWRAAHRVTAKAGARRARSASSAPPNTPLPEQITIRQAA